MNYENRIVAFIDILGFKQQIDKTIDKNGNDVNENITAIVEAYDIIRNAWDLDEAQNSTSETLEKESKKSKKVITIFSDTIVVSFLQKAESEIFWTLLEIKWMIMNLINRGILCRGAVSYGKLIHTDKIVFGPALIDAYFTESKAALYPRVIATEEIIQLAGKSKSGHHTSEEEIEFVKDLLKQDFDGMFYIDYFTEAEKELDDIEDYPNYIGRMGELIKKGLRNSKPEIKIKYMWMKEKINIAIDSMTTKENIKRLNKSGYHEISDVLKKLKRV